MKLKKDSLPKWAPLAGIVLAGLVVAFVGWKLVVSPQGKKATALDAQAASVQDQIAKNIADAAKARQTPTVPQIKVADVYKLAKAMPSTADVPDLLIELSQVARDAGVSLTSLSPGTTGTDPATGQQSVPIAMNVTGDFYTVTDLLYRLRNFVFVRDGALEATGRLFSIDSVTLAPGAAGKALTASLNMHAFVYGASSAPATAPTTVPTDTSTTSTDTTTTTPSTSSGAPSAAGAP